MIIILLQKSDSPDGIILSRLYESGPHHGGTESFLNQFINEVPKEESKFDIEVNVSEIGVLRCVNQKINHFICMMSLPFPPCDTNYKVIVYEDIGTIGRTES